MPLSLDQFAAQVSASGLLSEAEVQSLRQGCGAADAEQFARELVKQKKLTAFQAQQCFSGKGRALTLGNYVVLDKLGQGGMGMVLKAQHRRMKRVVALKVLAPTVAKSPELVARFQREVEAAARLTHPNIVAAYDADEANGTVFLVMEYVDGKDLSSLVKSKGPLPVDQAVECILQAARGLEYAHQRGVIHRDIKPANLLLSQEGTVKILDMGLARIEGEAGGQAELTSTGAVMGTVDYMAPEQALSTKHADARSDVYSLGISLWYLLVGRPAYDGDSLMARLLAHREAPIPSLQGARGEVPAALDAVFQKMIAKRPGDRWQSLTEVITHLERSLSGDAGAPSVTRSQSEDSRLSAFLSQLDGSTPSTPTATLTPPTDTQPLPTGSQYEATVASAGSEQPTDPQTLTQLPATKLLAAQSGQAVPTRTRAAWWTDRRILIGGGALAMLLIALLVATRDRPDAEATRSGGSAAASAVAAVPVEALQSPPGPGPAPAASGQPGPTGFALQFDGGSTVDLGGLLKNDTGVWTIEAWVRVDAPSPNGVIYAPGSQSGLRLDSAAGSRWRMSMLRDPTGHLALECTSAVELGRWSHVAGVFEPTRITLYVDGVLAQSQRRPAERIKPLGTPPLIGLHFTGAIDEIRVSDTVRYDGNFTVPTRHEPDQQTLALYHFDEGSGEVARDSSRFQRNGRLRGAKWIRSGVAASTAAAGDAEPNYALRFDSTTCGVPVPRPYYDGSHPLTVEAWVKPAVVAAELLPPQGECHLFSSPLLSVDFNLDSRAWRLQTRTEKSNFLLSQRALHLEDDAWTHVAAILDGQSLALYVNGVRKFTQPLDAPLRSGPEITATAAMIGDGPENGRNRFQGLIDELRISRSVRYTQDFTPRRRLDSDGETLALYHFDEGSGDRVADASPLGRHLQLNDRPWGVRPQWARVDGSMSTSPLPAVARSTERVALQFDGIDDRVEVDGFEYDGASPFTVEARVIRPDLSVSGSIVSYFAPTIAGQHSFGLVLPEPGVASFFHRHSLGWMGSGNVELGPALNQHLAGVYDGQVYRLFVDGNLIATAPLQPGANTNRDQRSGPLLIGAALDNAGALGYFFRGKITELKISQAARYTEGFAAPDRLGPDTQTIALYRFQEGAGDVLSDSSGNGRDGRIIGAKWVQLDAASADLSPAIATQPAPGSTGAAAPQPRDLLALADPQRDGLVFNHDLNYWEPGGWTKLPDGWRSSEGPRHLLRLPHVLTAPAYSLAVDLELTGGAGGLWIVLPMAQTECYFSYNGSKRGDMATAGLAYVDGLQETQNETTVEHPRLRERELVRLTFDVDLSETNATIVARVNGAELTRFAGPISRLSILDFRQFADGRKLTFAVGSTNAQILYRRVELTEFPAGRRRSAGQPLPAAAGPTSAPGGPFALQFDGVDDVVDIPLSDAGLKLPVTIEAWMEVDEFAPGRGAMTAAHLMFGPQLHLTVVPEGPQQPPRVAGKLDGVNPPMYAWQSIDLPLMRSHVALVADVDRMDLYVDGKRTRRGSPSTGERTAHDWPPALSLGGRGIREKFPPLWFRGRLSEIRLSSSARYDRDFVPAPRFEPDAHTVGLYHCDEGQGEVLRDSSGNDHHGKILGATWVRIDGAPAPATPRTIDLAALLDLDQDRVTVPNYVNANNWSIANGKLTYSNDGKSGKLVFPLDMADVREFEIALDVKRLSGNNTFTIDFAPAADKWSGLDFFIGGKIELKVEGGQRKQIGTWPTASPDGGKLIARIRHGQNGQAGSVTVTIDSVEAARWEGNVAGIGGRFESHPRYPGTQNLGLFCYRDSFEFTNLQLRVLEGSVRLLRPPATTIAQISHPLAPGLDLQHQIGENIASARLPAFLKATDPQCWEVIVTPRSNAGDRVSRSILQLDTKVGLAQYRTAWSWFVLDSARRRVFVTPPDSVQPGARTHLAGVSTGTELRLYINGRLAGRAPFNGADGTIRPLTIGGAGNPGASAVAEPFDGVLHAVRISGMPRYDADFTPPTDLEADADTLALYHLDEGFGDVLNDASGHNRHGRINGLKWVPVAASGSVDREVAEWVIGKGGGVWWWGAPTSEVKDRTQLPSAPFTLRSLYHVNIPVTTEELERVSQLSGLWKLALHGSGATDAGLEHFRDLPYLRQVQVYGCPVTDRSIAALSSLERLDSVNLGGTLISGDGIRELARTRPGITEWHIADLPTVTDATLDVLKQLPTIHHIDVRGTPVTKAAVEGVLKAHPAANVQSDFELPPPLGTAQLAPSLDLLGRVDRAKDALRYDVAAQHWTPGGWTQVATGWQSSAESRCLLRSDAPVAPPCRITVEATLQSDTGGLWLPLQIGPVQCYVTTNGYAKDGKAIVAFGYVDSQREGLNDTSRPHRQLTAGQSVRIDVDVTVQGAEAALVAFIDGVEATRFSGPVSRLSIPENFTRLNDNRPVTCGVGTTDGVFVVTKFEMHSHTLPNAASGADPPGPAAAAAPVRNDAAVLAWVRSLGGTIRGSPQEGGYRSVRPDEPLPPGDFSLHVIDLANKPVRDEDLSRFDQLPELGVLTLSGSPLTVAGLRRLGRLPKLGALYLGGPGLNDEALAEIVGRFPQLEILHFGESRVTDAGVTVLQGCPNLRSLSLYKTPITDAAIDALSQLASLRTLVVSSTGITPAGADRLHAALPHCRITWNGGEIAPVNYALDLSKNGDETPPHVLLPMLLSLTRPFTIECRVKPRSLAHSEERRTIWHNQGRWELQQLGDRWVFSATGTDAAGPSLAKSSAVVEPGVEVHLAGVFTGTELLLFVDGQLSGRSAFNVTFGEAELRPMLGHGPKFDERLPEAGGTTCFDGLIDDVRISTTARYLKDFPPPVSLTVDADTLALYHCDEGEGDLLRDASRSHHGQIVNGRWVKAETAR